MKYSIFVMMGLLAMGLFLTGCQDTSKPTTQASAHTGTYTLVTVNDNKVPYIPVPEGSAPQVQSGAFTLNADGSVTHATNFGQVDGKELSHDSNGTYTLDGSRVSFQWTGGGTTTATLEGNTLTLDWEGAIFVYRK
jgi:hypothetical protein